jgi:membrane protease YdiL (CAAX protease family)
MDITFTILMFVPLILILWLANFSERSAKTAGAETPAEGVGPSDATGDTFAPTAQAYPAGSGQVWAILAYLLLATLYGVLILFGVTLQLIGLLATGPMDSSLGSVYQQMGIDPASFARMGLGMWLPSIFGLLLLLRFVRNLVGRILPSFDPTSPVHAVALSYTALIAVNLFMTLGIGLGNLAEMIQAAGPMDLTASLWAQQIVMAIMALVGVGWLARRSFGETFRRLAIVRPSVKQVLAGVGLGIMMGAVISIIEVLLSKAGIAGDADVAKLSEQLLGPLTQSAFGIITLGVAAAIGEESIFRGALLPRFGLIFTTLLFALLHSTYGFSLATLIVFGVGLVLGIVRLRSNTTTSMLVHAFYNMTLGMIAALGLLQNI